MLFVSFCPFHDLKSLFTSFKVPKIGVHYRTNNMFQSITRKFKEINGLELLFFDASFSSNSRKAMDYNYALIKKYPSLAYFDLRQAVSNQQLETIGPQVNLDPRVMSQAAKNIHKIIRRFAIIGEQQMREQRQLIKYLKSTPNIECIILNNSKLKSIEYLSCKYLQNLQEVQLANNEIRSLSPLKKLKSPSLQQLDMNSNFLEDLRPLRQVFWPKLKILNLSCNRIVSIQSLPIYSFVSIKNINLSDNFLSQVRNIRKSISHEIKSLKNLNLSNNEITDIKWLSECNFYGLEYLNLRNNKYSSFLSIEKMKMSSSEPHNKRILISHYQILVSNQIESSKYCLGYRKLSRHKLSAKIETVIPRNNRNEIQKSRKIILL